MKLTKLKAKSSGFTLIELLIYLAITAGIVTSFVYFALNTSGGSEKSVIVTQVNNEARFVLNFIAAKVREANAVTTPVSGASGATLVLDMPSPAVDLTFNLDGSGNLQVTEAPSTVTQLTSSNLQVTNLVFNNFAPSGERSNIGIRFTLSTRPPAGGLSSPELAYTTSVRTAVSRRK